MNHDNIIINMKKTVLIIVVQKFYVIDNLTSDTIMTYYKVVTHRAWDARITPVLVESQTMRRITNNLQIH